MVDSKVSIKNTGLQAIVKVESLLLMSKVKSESFWKPLNSAEFRARGTELDLGKKQNKDGSEAITATSFATRHRLREIRHHRLRDSLPILAEATTATSFATRLKSATTVSPNPVWKRERKEESPVTAPDFDEPEEAAEAERRGGREIEEEEEGEQERRILAIKEQIEDPHQSEDALGELLQNLEDMDIMFKALKETDIRRHVNHLRKHDSGEIRRVAKQLVRKWKDIVDDWVKRNKPDALPSSYVVLQVWKLSEAYRLHNEELMLFLEVELGRDLLPTHRPNRAGDELLLLFKLYDFEKKELRYVGRLFVISTQTPMDILMKLNEMAGFPLDEEIELYEIVHFRSLEKPKEDKFCIELSRSHTYDDVVEKVAQRLGLDGPSKIRLTSHNVYCD
ncbi:hypothetical protein Droror1_Dr00019944 [Drosera rotundifolia]